MQKEKESGCGHARFDGMHAFLSAGGADVFMNLKKNKENKNKKKCVWVKDWIRKCCTKHGRRSQINKQERES